MEASGCRTKQFLIDIILKDVTIACELHTLLSDDGSDRLVCIENTRVWLSDVSFCQRHAEDRIEKIWQCIVKYKHASSIISGFARRLLFDPSLECSMGGVPMLEQGFYILA